MDRNTLFHELSEKYLFQEISSRFSAFQEKNKEKKPIFLGIGDTIQPLCPSISKEIVQIGSDLSTKEGYRGYGPDQGLKELRKAIQEKLYGTIPTISENDIFISDGAKCDIQRMHLLFGETASIAIQDPSYPAYKDSSFFIRRKKPISISVPLENEGDIDLKAIPDNSLLFLCHPNNPTGTLFSRNQLTHLVEFALRKKHIIIFDVAYRDYIQGDALRSIYEIPGAEKIAIEVGSFSKSAGFSGIRLGWSIVPKQLLYNNGESIQKDYLRLIGTTFNGASYISQRAGIAALSESGRKESLEQVQKYKENLNIIKESFQTKNVQLFGGIHAPYIWVTTPFTKSWDAFDFFLESAYIVTTPGIGFGNSGEGYIRISGFCSTEDALEAAKRIKMLEL